jgi:hypothetical protein
MVEKTVGLRRGGGSVPALPALHFCYILRAGAIRPNALSEQGIRPRLLQADSWIGTREKEK